MPPNRIDLLNNIEGVRFDDAWQAKTVDSIEVGKKEIPVFYIGLAHLTLSKERAGRDKDREDLKYLRQIQ